MIQVESSNQPDESETFEVGDLVFTRYQLDRFKKAFIFLVSYDDEFRNSLRKVMRRYIDVPIGEPLTKAQMVRRLQEFGPLAFKYRGKVCGFYASEVYAAFGEYTRKEVLQMLMDNGIWIRSGSRIHPKTGKNVRTHILDIC